MAEMIRIEVAYALPHKQKILALDVPLGTSVLDAAKMSGITAEFPELQLDGAKMGVFGKAVANPAAEQLRAGDRVEIYRPLLIDPKQARLNRAAKSAEE